MSSVVDGMLATAHSSSKNAVSLSGCAMSSANGPSSRFKPVVTAAEKSFLSAQHHQVNDEV